MSQSKAKTQDAGQVEPEAEILAVDELQADPGVVVPEPKPEPGAPVSRKPKFDASKPHGLVYGGKNVKYFQDGKYFDASGKVCTL